MTWLERRSERFCRSCAVAFAAWIVSLVGCGGSGGPGGGPSSAGPSDGGSPEAESGVDASALQDAGDADGPVTEACTAYAHAYCANLASCLGLAFASVFGDAATCEHRIAQFCPDRFAAPGTADTPSALTACAAAIAAQSCGPFRIGLPAACFLSGSAAVGAACRFDAQCQSSFCAIPAGSSGCGTCQPLAGEGEACDPSVANCASGLVCADTGCASDGGACGAAPQTICVSPRQEGEACDVSADCVPPLRCFQDSCAMPAEMGDPCGENGCDDTATLYCVTSPDGGASTCVEASLVPVGGACNSISQSPVLCAGSGSCRSLTGTAADVGTCAAPAADGDACGDALCLPPATCVNGACQVPVPPSSCM